MLVPFLNDKIFERKIFGLSILLILLFICSALRYYLNLLIPVNIDKKILSNLTFFLSYAVFVAPFLEENLFRAILIRNKVNLFFFILSIVFYFINFKLLNNSYLLTIIFVVISLCYYIHEQRRIRNGLNNKYIFVVSILLFYLSHSINFELQYFSNSLIINSPILLGGLILSLVRIKYGILFSFLLHFLNNLIFVGLIVVFK